MQRWPMNPSDCVFHALDFLLRRQGYPGGGTFMVLETSGVLDTAALAAALGGATAAHPVIMAAPRISRLRAWPYWGWDGRPVAPVCAVDDLTAERDWRGRADELCRARFAAGWDVDRAPQVRLEHYRGTGGEQRLCLRWPHALMDAEGAQLYLAELDRSAREPAGEGPTTSAAGRRPTLPADSARIDPLAAAGAVGRLRHLLHGLHERAPRVDISGARLAAESQPPARPATVGARGLCYLVRCWSPEASAEVRERARRIAPAGPALYARHLAACTLRAIARLHGEHGRPLPFCGLMFPMRLPGPAARPMRGNYLVAAALGVAPEVLADRRALAEALAEQLARYAARDGALASWSLQRLTAQLRVGQYRRVLERETARQPYATGFSYYGELDPPLRHMLGAPITNMYGGGVVSNPPGWNVTFSRFADRLNLVLAWPEGVFPEGAAERYAELIESELFETSPVTREPRTA